MVKELVKIANIVQGPLEQNSRLVSQLLKEMEFLGMLPPLNDSAYSDYYGGDSVGEGVDKYCKWSDE